MGRVAVRCEDGHLVPAVLQANRGIDDQALRPADAQVGVEEDDMLFRVRHAGRVFAERRQLRVARRGMGWAAGHLSASELVPRRARQVKDDLGCCT